MQNSKKQVVGENRWLRTSVKLPISGVVMTISASLFLWVQFYGGFGSLPLIPSFKIYTDCNLENHQGFVSIQPFGRDDQLMLVTFGVDAKSSDCHDLRLFVPSIVWLSLGPGVTFPSMIRSIKTLGALNDHGLEQALKGQGRENLPDGSFVISRGPIGQTVIDIDMTKLESPSGYFDFVWSGAIVRNFESYFVRVPINTEHYPDIDGRYHTPSSYIFNAFISGSMNIENLKPDSAQVSHQMGYTRLLVPSMTEGEISFTLKSPYWHNVGTAIQWVAGVFFGIFAGYFLTALGSAFHKA